MIDTSIISSTIAFMFIHVYSIRFKSIIYHDLTYFLIGFEVLRSKKLYIRHIFLKKDVHEYTRKKTVQTPTHVTHEGKSNKNQRQIVKGR